jgi:hypothetical protein
MIAGQLEIQLLANMARLQKDMDDAKRSVGGAMDAIEKSVGMAKAALGALGAGLSVGAMIEMAKKTIDAADAMNDLSQRVGIAVKDLGKYELAASQSGTTMEALAKGIKGVAGNLAEHGDALKKAGITATTADEAMTQFADIFSKMPDGIEKTNLAVKVFGKSGMDLIPMLNMGSDGLKEAAEKSAKYAAQMAILAPQADKFNDNMAELAMASKVAGMSLMNELMPALIRISQASAMAAQDGGKLQAVWAGLGSGVYELIGRPFEITFLRINAYLDEANAKMLRFFGKNKEAGELLNAVNERHIKILALEAETASPSAVEPPKFDTDKWMGDYKKLIAAMKDGSKEAESELKLYTSTLQRLEQEMGNTIHQTEEQKVMYQLASGSLRTLTADHAKEVIAKAKEVDAIKAAMKVAEARIDQRKKEQDAIDDYFKSQTEGYNAAIKSSNDALKAAQDEYAQFGMSKSQIAEITLLKLESAKASFTEGSEGYNAAQKQIDAQKELIGVLKKTEVLEEWKSIFDSIDRTAHDTFISIFDSGKNAFDRLRDTLKNGLFDLLYQMTIKKWIFSIGAAVSGAPGIANAAGSAGNAIGMASNGWSLYNAGSTVAGWLGMGGAAMGAAGATGITAAAGTGLSLASAGGGVGLSAGAASAGMWGAGTTAAGMGTAGAAGVTAASAGAAGAGAAGGGIMAGIGSAIAAIPVWGWALAAAALLAKSLDHSGTYHTGSASTSSAAGTQAIDPRSLGFMQTVISPDSQKMTDGISASVANMLNSTATNFGKSAGYSAATAFADDTSKDGAWGALLINKMGDKLIDWDSNRQSRWAPREFADGQAGQQQYIAALSASVRTALDSIGLPAWAQKMLDGLGSAPTIEALSSVVDNINATQQALVVMGETLTGFADLSDSAVSALIAASGGIQALAGNANTYYENFYTDAEKAANTTKQVTEVLSKFGIAMPATREEFRAQVEAQMALGESGAPAVAALLKVAGAVSGLIPVADAASTALRDVTKNALTAATTALQKSVDAERSKLTKAYDDSLSAITKRIDKLRSLSDALNSSLGSRSVPGQFGADYAQAQAQIMTAVAIARAGGILPDASSLQKALATVAQPTEQLFATFTDYQRDFLKTSNSIKDLADLTDGQLSVEDRSLKVLEDSYKGGMSRLDSIIAATGKVDESVLSLPAAIAAYNAASKAAGGSAISDPAGVSANTGAGVASYDYVQAAVADASKYGQNAYAFIPGINDYAAKMDAASGLGARLGISAEDALQQSTGYSSSYWRAAQDAYDSLQHPTTTSIPGFASGGDHMGGLRIVGERGIELESTGPSRIWNADQTRRMISGGDNSELISEIRALRETVAEQQATLDKIEKSSLKTAQYAEITYGEAQA